MALSIRVLALLVLALVVVFAQPRGSDAIELTGLKRTEALMGDPRFSNCMEDTYGPEDPNYMSVFARCYAFAGRPRFGKRGSNYKDIAALFKHYRMLRELYGEEKK